MLFSLHDQKYRDVHDCDCFWRIYYADGKTAFVCKRGSGWKTLHSWPKMVFGEKEVCSSRKNTHIINPPTTNQPPLDRRALIRGIARPAVLRREKGGHCTDAMVCTAQPKIFLNFRIEGQKLGSLLVTNCNKKVFIVDWPCFLTTKPCCLQKDKSR